MSVCANCEKESKADTWSKGEALLFGMIYFCSKKCALEWVSKNEESVRPIDEDKDLEEIP
jgi:hypothetical protein